MTLALTDATIAANRFGLGARPGELARVAAAPRDWLLAQLQAPAALPQALQGLPDSPAYASQFADWLVARRRARRAGDGSADEAVASFRETFRDDLLAEIAARGRVQVETQSPFLERLTRFWANHFAVSADKVQVSTLVGAYQREAIRPRVLGSFADLLLAVERHPAWKRVLVAERMAAYLPAGFEPMTAARDALGPFLPDTAATALARAESPQQAGALLLAGPDFQWR